MSISTVIIKPLLNGTTQAQLRFLFAAYPIARIAIKQANNQEQAYIEFASPDIVEQMASKYEDCKVKELGDAEISFVDADFTWDSLIKDKPDSGQTKIKVNIQNAIVVKECEQGFKSEKELREIFAKLNVEKIGKEGRQVVVEFSDVEQLEKLQSVFPGLKIKALGPNAYIDIDNEVKVDDFINIWNKQQEQQKLAQEKQEIRLKQKAKQEEEAKIKKEQEQVQEEIRKIEEKEKQRKEEEDRKKEEQAKIKEEEARNREELMKRREEQLRKFEEARRKEEELRKQLEEDNIKKREEELKKELKEKRQKEEAEAKKKEEEEARKQEEEKKRKEEDQKRKKEEDEKRKKEQDEKRKKQEDEKRKKEEDQKRKKEQDEKRKKEEDQKRKKEEDEKRKADEQTKKKEDAQRHQKEREEFKLKKQKQLQQIQRIEQAVKRQVQRKQKQQEQQLIKMRNEAKSLIENVEKAVQPIINKAEINLIDLHHKSEPIQVLPAINLPQLPQISQIKLSPVKEQLSEVFQVRPSVAPSPAQSKYGQLLLTFLLALWVYWIAFK